MIEFIKHIFGFCTLEVVGVEGYKLLSSVIVQFHIIEDVLLYIEASTRVSQLGAHWFPITGLNTAFGLGYTVMVSIIVSVHANPPLPPACIINFTSYVTLSVYDRFVNT